MGFFFKDKIERITRNKIAESDLLMKKKYGIEHISALEKCESE
jgi:hypothetical protein